MSSVLPGYSYDVFISYRQKDNRSDQWVTRFVEALRDELDSTFKEEISIYFDANPHDGLSDTHDVDESLKEKIKALIFIPVVSQTYCDPNSFAWKCEYLAFLNFARTDGIGLDVKVPGGNVAKRVLPVRIHELEPADKQFFEQALGAVMRPVDFIYREPGVNRPLRAKDDDAKEITHTLFYRDQVNKVANGVKEVLNGIRKKPVVVKHAAEEPQPRVKPSSNSNRKWWVLALAVFVIMAGIWLYPSWAKPSRETLKAQLLPALRESIETHTVMGSPAYPSDISTFRLAMHAREQLGDDPDLNKLWRLAAHKLSITTNPPGAEVSWRTYADPIFVRIGNTPIDSVDMPNYASVLRLTLPGFDTVWRFTASDRTLHFNLDSVGKNGSRMAHVPGIQRWPVMILGLDHHGAAAIPPFLIDRMEVTNAEYKLFVDAGGYQNPAWWKHPIRHEGKTLSIKEAASYFVDKSGRTGPSTWEAGTFPDGKASHPVSGVSWYEAAAYATFARKSLPTVFHWSRNVLSFSHATFIVPRSNFSRAGTAAVGSFNCPNRYGCEDMAGNVREWMLNETPDGQRYTLGGAFNDPPYMHGESNWRPAMDRSEGNGFRCMRLLPGDTTLQTLNRPLDNIFRDYKKESPASLETSKLFLSYFDYDHTPLNPVVKHLLDTTYYVAERVELDSHEGKEKEPFYLFIPKAGKPPYNAVMYWPGSDAIGYGQFNPRDSYIFDFFAKSNYALAVPILRGTFERSNDLKTSNQDESIAYRQRAGEWIKQFRRTMDYLDTREEVVHGHYGFFGHSWGGAMAPILLASDNRFDAVIILTAGLRMQRALPEVDPINFLPRTSIPVLMLNGKYDTIFPLEVSQNFMFNWWATPADKKKLILFEGGHSIPKAMLIKESLEWFDLYLARK